MGVAVTDSDHKAVIGRVFIEKVFDPRVDSGVGIVDRERVVCRKALVKYFQSAHARDRPVVPGVRSKPLIWVIGMRDEAHAPCILDFIHYFLFGTAIAVVANDGEFAISVNPAKMVVGKGNREIVPISKGIAPPCVSKTKFLAIKTLVCGIGLLLAIVVSLFPFRGA